MTISVLGWMTVLSMGVIISSYEGREKCLGAGEGAKGRARHSETSVWLVCRTSALCCMNTTITVRQGFLQQVSICFMVAMDLYPLAGALQGI